MTITLSNRASEREAVALSNFILFISSNVILHTSLSSHHTCPTGEKTAQLGEVSETEKKIGTSRDGGTQRNRREFVRYTGGFVEIFRSSVREHG